MIAQRQRGAYLAMMAVLVVALVGISALVLDLGRVLALRGDMQAAVDAAALAAALELDGHTGARERARSAARELLAHDSGFAEVNDLLGADGLPDDAFQFFCVIGAATDVDPGAEGFGDFCGGSEAEPGKFGAVTDEDAHYVRITLSPALAGEERFTARLFFLPVLRVFGEGERDSVGLVTRALAGRAFYFCNFPPMAICDPFEPMGSRFRDEMTEGGHIQLKQQGSNQWSHGNFGFLEPGTGGAGASDVAPYLADEGILGCEPPVVTTKTGNMSNKTAAALNTRFDAYGEPPAAPFNQPDAWQLWPPAPNVTEYPLDSSTEMTDARFGQGDWDFDNYWAAEHPALPAPNGWSNSSLPSRWDVYNWEIDNGAVPASGTPDPTHLHTGAYPPAVSDAGRRLFYVAVLSCEALGLTGGKSDAVVFAPDGFARIFMLRKAEGPPVGEFYGEYLGWAGRGDANYHVEVQLYE